ncbi:MAG: proton-conducting transporter membrane subunit [Candidatus Moranbacteria bacterium]|nr:proton-conducting transporter membrane subunit [Candidatus Moranbacteria bacterium]
MMAIIITIFLFGALLPQFLKDEKHIRRGAVWAASAGGLAVSVFALPVLFGKEPSWSDSWWMIDPFSALMASLIVFTYMAAIVVSYRYIGHEYQDGIVGVSQVRMYFSLISLFELSMLAVVFADNAMLMWLSLEGTTLFSAFLVGLYKKKTSVEAAWKYVILCSTGITLGLAGVLLMNYAGDSLNLDDNFFSLLFLTENAHLLPPEIIKWAFVFLFVGFGTKVGLVPMHAWLPDAHSKAPSPISALFSGVLLNVALYVIIRFKHIADSALGGSEWTNGFFLVFGLLSIALPALALLIQDNYKRMLAYSSIEHMGLMSLAIAFSPLGLVAAFIHMIGHTFTKSALFFGAGEFLLKWKTTKISKIGSTINHAPYTSVLFLVGILAIIAAPPSVIFFSEFILFSRMFSTHWILAICTLIAMSLVAFSMLHLAIRLVFEGESEEKMEKEKWNSTHTVISIELVLAFGLSFVLISPPGLAFIESLVKIVN